MIKIELGNYDQKYAKGIIEREKPEDIVLTLIGLLNKTRNLPYQDTCSLIRDLVLGPFGSPKNKVFNRLFDRSKAISILENNILAGNYFERSASIYTLAKICSRKSVPAMRRSLKDLALRDPVNASDLVSEIWWLSGNGDENWKLIDKLASFGFYQKWGALHILTHWSGRGAFEKNKVKYIREFAAAGEPLIRIEALYLLEEKKIKRKPIEEESASPSMPSWEPMVVFDNLRIGIGNSLYQNKKTDYKIKDLDDLVDSRLKKPCK